MFLKEGYDALPHFKHGYQKTTLDTHYKCVQGFELLHHISYDVEIHESVFTFLFYSSKRS